MPLRLEKIRGYRRFAVARRLPEAAGDLADGAKRLPEAAGAFSGWVLSGYSHKSRIGQLGHLGLRARQM